MPRECKLSLTLNRKDKDKRYFHLCAEFNKFDTKITSGIRLTFAYISKKSEIGLFMQCYFKSYVHLPENFKGQSG